MSTRARLLSIAVALAAAAAPAAAGTFQISTTRLELADKGSSSIITLTNTGTEPVRLQAKAFSWRQSASGEQELGAASELVVFPTLFTLAPGASRKVKVGTTVPPQARERTYRLFLEEMPAPSASKVPGLHVLTRMNVPIFQAPLRQTRAGSVSRVELSGNRLTVDVRNLGTVSVMLKAAKTTGKDAGGKTVWEGEAKGWYLLAGGLRTFELEIPADKAAAISSVEVEATTDRDTWKHSAKIPPRAPRGS